MSTQLNNASQDYANFASFLIEKNIVQGEEVLKALVSQIKTSPELLVCADFFLKQKKFEVAEEIYKSILKKETANASALKGFAVCLYFSGKFDSALRCFSALKSLASTDAIEAWLYACFSSMGKVKEAKVFERENFPLTQIMKQEGIAIDCY